MRKKEKKKTIWMGVRSPSGSLYSHFVTAWAPMGSCVITAAAVAAAPPSFMSVVRGAGTKAKERHQALKRSTSRATTAWRLLRARRAISSANTGSGGEGGDVDGNRDRLLFDARWQ